MFINNKAVIHKERILKLQNHPKGYKIVTLTKKGKQKTYLVHILVANAFIPNPDNKPEVNHKDTNKTNNRADNLEWNTRSENMQHAKEHKLINYNTRKKGAENPRAIQVKMIDKDKNTVLKIFGSIVEAAKYIEVDKSCHIVSCCKGKLKTAYGYKWEYGRQ